MKNNRMNRAILARNLHQQRVQIPNKMEDVIKCVKTEKYSYANTDLLSCMTLDVQHFHAKPHFRNYVMSMLQYCRSSGNCKKESIKIYQRGVFTTSPIQTVGILCLS